ncbi:O-acetyl-ADP-ribose deacetylase [Azospirillum canadense]|uniref:O-acetyl-ADP-ribose deacetylase n=1 Tax=Azospirillum canadense TaxID=403962 RepID=UPI002226227A|nr:O-acetyl-ADP-ribose deacetylase [Azospirillum canadense]MCW2235628.1 O-acetyl-ADP-ribose deacetylase (regulator of RNase III) [Azospirillum canadense]
MDRIRVVEDDITRQTVDAIVNAANAALKAGGGVDGAIHRAAGPDLQRELDGIGGCPTGDCRLSQGYNLPAPYIIHCVGPVWHGGGSDEERLLESCYRSALALARRHGIRTLAFPAISTGIYGFPKQRAAEIAVAAVRDEMSKDDTIEEVRFVVFDAETAGIYRALV